MKKIRFSGVMPPVTTPFAEDGALLYDSLERNLQKYRQTRLAGFVLLGSNGESPHLSEAEKLDILRLAESIVPADRYLIAGIGFAAERQALAFLEKIHAFRLHAVLVSVPSYYKNRMNHQALFHYFSTLADRSPFPVLLYNVPQYSGVELLPELIRDLAAHPNIAGMKESSGNLVYLQRVLELTRDRDFQVMLGSAQVLGPALALGIRAAIVAIACAVPELPIGLVADFLQGKEIAEKQRQVFEISMALTAQLGVPGLKYAMDSMGYEGKFCRLPLLPLTSQEQAHLDTVLHSFLDTLPAR